MEQDNVKWKYNLKDHKVVEQPTIAKPDFYRWSSGIDNTPFQELINKYEEHLASRRSIPVSGKAPDDWKDGEDVTGKFLIEVHPVFNSVQDVAIPIKQEQPRPHPDYELNSGRIDKIPMVATVKNQSKEQDNVTEVSEKYWKRNFEFWLLNNAKLLQPEAHTIISHVEHYFISPLLQQNKELQSRLTSIEASNQFHKQQAHEALAEQYRLQKENEELKEQIKTVRMLWNKLKL